MQLQMTEVELAPILNGAVASTSALWRTGLPRHPNSGRCAPCWADADRIAQVMVNL